MLWGCLLAKVRKLDNPPNIRNMQTDTPVDTYHKHTHVITHTDTGAYRQLPEKLVYIKLAERTVLMVA